jgi:hypothetical protein
VKCPLCASSVTYIGLNSLECLGPTCPNAGSQALKAAKDADDLVAALKKAFEDLETLVWYP